MNSKFYVNFELIDFKLGFFCVLFIIFLRIFWTFSTFISAPP